MKHHKNGPSSLYKRLQCPASLFMEGIHEDEESKFSSKGTMLHEMVGIVYNKGDIDELDQRDEDLVLKCCDNLDLMTKEYDLSGEWLFEVRLELFDSKFNLLTFGTCDALLVDEDAGIALLRDFKFGYNPVNAPEENIQLATYSAAVMQKYGVSKVIAAIDQPTLGINEDFVFTDCKSIVSFVEEIINECGSFPQKFKAGSHCTYCKARSVCDVCNEWGMKCISTDDSEIDSENAGDLYDSLKVLNKKVEETKEKLKRVVSINGGILGDLYLKSVSGRASCKLDDAFDVLGIDDTIPELIRPALSISASDLEKVFVKKALEEGIYKTKKEAKDEFYNLDCISRGTPYDKIEKKR